MCPPVSVTRQLSSLQTLVDICGRLPQTQVPELVVSLVSLTVLIVAKEINNYYRKKLPVPIPIELLVVSSLSHHSRGRSSGPRGGVQSWGGGGEGD